MKPVRARHIVVALLAVLCAGLLIDGASGRGTPNSDRYGFFVRVLGLDDNGDASPLEDAVVGVHPGETAGTNAKGMVFVRASPSTTKGDEVTLEASKDGFQDEHIKLLVNTDTAVRELLSTRVGKFISFLLRRHTPEITLTLPQSKGPLVDLVVQVKDSALKPVQGAHVSLDRINPPLTSLGSSYTTAHGDATFLVPRAEIASGLRAKVFAGAHGKRFSDIPPSVLEGGGRRIFLVVLPGPNTFTRVASETEVHNAQGAALTIDPGGSADLDHTGQYGGEGKGGEWKIHYTWQVPSTLTPGMKDAITLTDTISDVKPEQPLSDGINVIGPDIAQQLIDRYPNGPTAQTYPYTLPADQESDFTITVGFQSSTVVYHYQRGG